MKKLYHRMPYVVLAALILIPTLLIIITTIGNNSIQDKFTKQLFDYKLLEKTTKIKEEYFRMVNPETHMLEYYAILYIRSDLDYKSVQEYYSLSKFDPIKEASSSFNIIVSKLDREIDIKFMKLANNFAYRQFDDTIPYRTYYEIMLTDVSEMSLFDLEIYK